MCVLTLPSYLLCFLQICREWRENLVHSCVFVCPEICSISIHSRFVCSSWIIYLSPFGRPLTSTVELHIKLVSKCGARNTFPISRTLSGNSWMNGHSTLRLPIYTSIKPPRPFTNVYMGIAWTQGLFGPRPCSGSGSGREDMKHV